MPTQIHTYSERVVDRSTLHGGMGKLHKSNTKAAKKLLHARPDEFSIKGESRMDRWINATKGFAKLGACTGALVGEVTMTGADLLMGRGGERNNLINRGLAGYAVRAGTEAASGMGFAAGATLGVAAAVVTDASRHGTGTSIKDHYNQNIHDGAEIGGKSSANVAGGIGGVLLDIARVPSLVVKKTLSTMGGLVMGTLGFLVGGFRAITDT